ncbi:SRPBCC domain-containing protein [Pedobacter sp. MW01-1-1]|uniref:SRPBCC domain-containing protein n=1 Tax=Pedobacter sp. MW01-1-1 TaxID=3383027 RepID=UPI003FEFC524
MKKIKFDSEINASANKVWEILFSEETYPIWSAVFSEGSKAITDWKKGSKALFVNADNDGMISEIAESIEPEFLSIRHLGMIMKGVEDLNHSWSGSLENYTLKELSDNKTLLEVEMDTTAEMADYFKEKWPLAIEKIKELAK